jgi:hypothetical protein
LGVAAAGEYSNSLCHKFLPDRYKYCRAEFYFKMKSPDAFARLGTFFVLFFAYRLTLLFIGGWCLDFEELTFIIFDTTHKDRFGKEPDEKP